MPDRVVDVSAKRRGRAPRGEDEPQVVADRGLEVDEVGAEPSQECAPRPQRPRGRRANARGRGSRCADGAGPTARGDELGRGARTAAELLVVIAAEQRH